jgi:hypothetical protein
MPQDHGVATAADLDADSLVVGDRACAAANTGPSRPEVVLDYDRIGCSCLYTPVNNTPGSGASPD